MCLVLLLSYTLSLYLQLVCSDVSTACFDDTCELTWSAKNLQPSQGVRFLSAIFLYEGILHWILITLFKLPTMWKIETRIRYNCMCGCRANVPAIYTHCSAGCE